MLNECEPEFNCISAKIRYYSVSGTRLITVDDRVGEKQDKVKIGLQY
jgi:hypothetical protein